MLINELAEGYFKCSRGVRQDHPLSLLLFGNSEDYLSRLLLRKITDNR